MKLHSHVERCPSPAPDAASPARETASLTGDAEPSPKFGICDTAKRPTFSHRLIKLHALFRSLTTFILELFVIQLSPLIFRMYVLFSLIYQYFI